MHTDQEAKAEVKQAIGAVNEDNAALREFVAIASKSNSRYNAAYQNRKPAQAAHSRLLQDISWINSSAVAVQASAADGFVGCSEPDGVQEDDSAEPTDSFPQSAADDGDVGEGGQNSIAANAKKTPRECVRKKARHQCYFG
jgi:hypothetical protein